MSKAPHTKPLILIDGSSYLFRAYHALPPLTNSKGDPTGAIYGVLNMLRKLQKDYDPAHIAVVFDPKGKTFRYDMYAQYKANRTKMPDELRSQIAPLHQAIEALGLPLIIVDGVEADDVIGTLALKAKQAGMQTLISTGDKDLAQLVDEDITLINTMTDKLMDRAGVEEKFGVPPELIIDYLALVGDTSDNVPGIPKVGPKTAVKWLSEYGSLDEIIKHADDIKGKVGENLRAHLEDLALSKQLVTVKLDVDLDIAIHTLSPKAADKAKLIDLFSRLEFKSWLSELLSEQPSEVGEKNYACILSEKDFQTWLARLKKAPYFSFDTETTALRAMDAELVGLSFAVKPHEAAYVPLAHDYSGAPTQLNRDAVLKALKPLLEDKNQIVIGQNLKYDLKMLRHYGIHVQAQPCDTLLESYVLNSTSTRHDLDSLALKYLAHNNITFEDIAGKGAKQLTFNQIHLDQASPYAAEDADIALQLHEKLWSMIEKEACYKKVLTEIEWPLIPILAKMEYEGVLIDAAMLKTQSKSLAKRIKAIEEEVFAMAGESFNLGSTKQLQAILYDKLQLPVLKKTPKGQPSTAEAALQELAFDYPLPKLILEYRSLTKLKSTYTDALPLQINSRTGRVHTSYNQAVTSTGRLSSNNPNLQNIPARTEEGRKIRQAFIAPKGYKIVAADYSQVELRIMAHVSQDPGLLKAFSQGLDVHSSTAAEVFGVKLEGVTPEMRRHAKAINFGLMYGMSSFGLSQQLGIDQKEAQKHIDVYFSRYPSVHQYMENARMKASEQGYVETLLGRRLYVPEIHASNQMRRRAAERAAINAPLQGTAADIIKLAMICIDRWISETNIDVKMIMQVHDELVFEVNEKCLEKAKKQIIACMEGALELSVPLIVDVGVGDNWDEAH